MRIWFVGNVILSQDQTGWHTKVGGSVRGWGFVEVEGHGKRRWRGYEVAVISQCVCLRGGVREGGGRGVVVKKESRWDVRWKGERDVEDQSGSQ